MLINSCRASSGSLGGAVDGAQNMYFVVNRTAIAQIVYGDFGDLKTLAGSNLVGNSDGKPALFSNISTLNNAQPSKLILQQPQ